MKENFYIFLDIDGVLWDWKWIIDSIIMRRIKKPEFFILNEFNPDSINAVNTLIATLSQKYNVDLIISSSRRRNMKSAIKTLYKNGLNFENEIHNTGKLFENKNRGNEIVEYLNEKQNNNNYVVIDNKNFNFNATIDVKKLIKTDVYNCSLIIKHIEQFFMVNPQFCSENITRKDK